MLLPTICCAHCILGSTCLPTKTSLHIPNSYRLDRLRTYIEAPRPEIFHLPLESLLTPHTAPNHTKRLGLLCLHIVWRLQPGPSLQFRLKALPVVSAKLANIPNVQYDVASPPPHNHCTCPHGICPCKSLQRLDHTKVSFQDWDKLALMQVNLCGRYPILGAPGLIWTSEHFLMLRMCHHNLWTHRLCSAHIWQPVLHLAATL